MIIKLLNILVFLSFLFGQIDYESQIQPIFNNHCIECHVSVNGSGALELDSYEYLMQGDSNNGPAVIPFNADSSLLYRVLLRDSVEVPNEPICCRMPKNADPLPMSDQQKIYNWINEGANASSLNNFESKVRMKSSKIMIYPNPFNSFVIIKYILKKQDKLVLTIHDVTGKQVKILSNTIETAGVKSIKWDSKDRNGKRVPSGLYFVSLRVNNQKEIEKLLLIN